MHQQLYSMHSQGKKETDIKLPRDEYKFHVKQKIRNNNIII